mgnify:CR=1 FL=1
MRTWEVEVQGTCTQRVLIEAECFVDAITQAEQDFDLLADDVSFDHEVTSVKEVGAEDPE